MSKLDLLGYLVDAGTADANDVSDALALDYAAAAMALLRLARQGLARRYSDADRRSYFYEITARGLDRLAFLRSRQ